MPRRRRPSSKHLFRSRVERRARGRCEYCRAPQRICGYRFHLEHIVPSSEGGSDALFNRALACAPCNLAKSDRISGVDPRTGNRVPLFDPRTQAWDEHFRWSADRASIVGITPTGRATVVVLDLNSEFRRQSRRFWFATGWLP